MKVKPMTLRAARDYVNANHRHHRAPQGGLFAVGCEVEGNVVGCAIVGKPIARFLNDGKTVEITRLCTDGTRNACSFLYRCCVRIANAMGYRRILTYTLADEGGASLRGAGFAMTGKTAGGSWSRKSRQRIDKHPTQEKLRWESNGNTSERSLPGETEPHMKSLGRRALNAGTGSVDPRPCQSE